MEGRRLESGATHGLRVTRRRVFDAGLGVGVVAAASAGCQLGTAPAQDTQAKLAGQIRFSHLTNKTDADVFAKLAGEFQQQYPSIQVSTEATWDWNNAKIIAAHVGGNAADIMWTSVNFYSPLYIRDVLQPIEPYMATDRQFKVADYFDTPLAALKFRGKQVGLPILWAAYVMYYNKTMFERQGRELPDESWTWSTFLDAARALTKRSADPSVMDECGFETYNHYNPWSPWVWGAGGDLFSADGLKCTLDTPAAIEGMQYLMDLMHRWRVAPTLKELSDRGLGTNAFITGKVGTVFNAITMLPGYRKVDLFEFDVAPIPKGPKGRWASNPTSGLVMWKGSRAPEAAWAFMRYLVSEQASKTYVTAGIAGMPVHKGTAQLILQDSRPPKHKQVFYDVYKYAKATFTTPYGVRAMQAFFQETREMWNDGKPAKDVLTEAVPKVNAVIQEEMAADTKK